MLEFPLTYQVMYGAMRSPVQQSMTLDLSWSAKASDNECCEFVLNQVTTAQARLLLCEESAVPGVQKD